MANCLIRNFANAFLVIGRALPRAITARVVRLHLAHGIPQGSPSQGVGFERRSLCSVRIAAPAQRATVHVPIKAKT